MPEMVTFLLYTDPIFGGDPTTAVDRLRNGPGTGVQETAGCSSKRLIFVENWPSNTDS